MFQITLISFKIISENTNVRSRSYKELEQYNLFQWTLQKLSLQLQFRYKQNYNIVSLPAFLPTNNISKQ